MPVALKSRVLRESSAGERGEHLGVHRAGSDEGSERVGNAQDFGEFVAAHRLRGLEEQAVRSRPHGPVPAVLRHASRAEHGDLAEAGIVLERSAFGVASVVR